MAAVVPDLTVKLDGTAVVAFNASLNVRVISDPAAFRVDDAYLGIDDAVVVMV